MCRDAFGDCKSPIRLFCPCHQLDFGPATFNRTEPLGNHQITLVKYVFRQALPKRLTGPSRLTSLVDLSTSVFECLGRTRSRNSRATDSSIVIQEIV